MSSRVTLTVVNKSGTTLKCTNVGCETFDNLKVGDTIAAGGQNTFTSSTNDRIFATFAEEAPGIGAWQLAMTTPRSSQNSACGSFNAGLQHYDRHDDGVFTFHLGSENLADWDNGDKNEGNVIAYGDCS